MNRTLIPIVTQSFELFKSKVFISAFTAMTDVVSNWSGR